MTTIQLDTFARDGYVIFPAVFDEREVAAFSREADRLLELTINASIALGTKNERLIPKRRRGGLEINMLQPVNDLSEVFTALSKDARLLDPMSKLMGTEPRLMEEKLNYKQSLELTDDLAVLTVNEWGNTHFTDEMSFPLHHDWGYYRAQGYPTDTLSSAISIDATGGRGPIRVVPGSHTRDWPMVNPDDASGNGMVDMAAMPELERVEVDVPAGSVMIFHSRLLHDSLPNNSGAPRRLMIYSHYPAWAEQGDDDRRNAPRRAAAQAHELAYRNKVAAGEYTDRFSLSS